MVMHQLNVTGRDSVFLAMMHGVKPDSRKGTRRVKDATAGTNVGKP